MKKVLSRQISAIHGSTASQGAPSPQRTCWLRRVASNLIKALSAFKGSSTLSAVGSIANNYDGMQVGFEMTK